MTELWTAMEAILGAAMRREEAIAMEVEEMEMGMKRMAMKVDGVECDGS